MPSPQDYVTDQARQAERVEDMSGVRSEAASTAMAPYPLYGLGQPEPSVAFWKRPWFCWVGGVALGAGVSYAVFGWLKPRMKRNPRKRKE